jgi:hypothetical protein
MPTYLPSDVQAGLDAARSRPGRRGHRLRVRSGETIIPVLRVWDGGFSLPLNDAPSRLRGLVDMYDGTRHLSRCLVIASSAQGDELNFEVKQTTEAGAAPPADFVRDPGGPAALIARD